MSDVTAAGALAAFAVRPMDGEAVGSPVLIEKGGERQFVQTTRGYDGWTVVAIGEQARPIEHGEWDGTRFRIPIPLLKVWKWEAMKAKRDQHKAAGCATPFGMVDTDPASIQAITLAAAEARETPETYADVWTMADDSEVQVTAADMRQILLSVTDHIRECHATCASLRAQIAAATTRPQITAIDWPPPHV